MTIKESNEAKLLARLLIIEGEYYDKRTESKDEEGVEPLHHKG